MDNNFELKSDFKRLTIPNLIFGIILFFLGFISLGFKVYQYQPLQIIAFMVCICSGFFFLIYSLAPVKKISITPTTMIYHSVLMPVQYNWNQIKEIFIDPNQKIIAIYYSNGKIALRKFYPIMKDKKIQFISVHNHRPVMTTHDYSDNLKIPFYLSGKTEEQLILDFLIPAMIIGTFIGLYDFGVMIDFISVYMVTTIFLVLILFLYLI